MTQHSPTQVHAPIDVPRPPRGILKNSVSYQNPITSPQADQYSPTNSSAISHENGPLTQSHSRSPNRQRSNGNFEASDKDLTLQNTLANMGPRRASSAAGRSSYSSSSRRHSSAAGTYAMDVDGDENGPRLKWDEANLYLTEQERGDTMKINEPKTPYAKQYDPREDEEEIRGLDARDLVVDELDSARGKRRESIPDLDLGEPEEEIMRFPSDGEKRVVVDDSGGEGAGGGHGEDEMLHMTEEERRKHREFEERRKKHYEMVNVKDLLAHLKDPEDDEE